VKVINGEAEASPYDGNGTLKSSVSKIPELFGLLKEQINS
jgi:hypothetical protein